MLLRPRDPIKALCRLLLAAFLCGATATHAQTEPAPADLDVLGQQFFARSGSTGMVLVLVRQGSDGKPQVDFRGLGETAPGSLQAPNPDSLLRLCSLSKIFATDLLVKLADSKLLRLDTSLQALAPAGAKVPSRDGRPITLGDLATHTAGLPREIANTPAGQPHFTFPDFDQRWAWLPTYHLRAQPGTVAAYSNIGFDLLGDALASAAHTPYARLLATRTTGPLAMSETTFSPTAAQCARLLQAAPDEGPCTDTQSTAGSSGLYSTARDMSRWLQYLLGDAAPAIPAQNVSQNPAAQAVYLAPAALASVKGLDHAGTPTGIGLGWMHLLDPTDDRHLIEKTGGGAGFLTYIALNPAHHAALFLAATDGPRDLSAITHFHLFQEANNVLLTLLNLTPIPIEEHTPKPVARKLPPKHRTSKRTSH